jgi:hypothetical protein
MSIPTTCPRCAGPLRAPGFWSSAWQCELHGEVHPFHAAPAPTLAAVERLVADSHVPVWVPRPLPAGWTVTGLARAGDDRTGVVASLVAVSGPAPGGGLADMVLIAEEPAVGLGARFAGLVGTDPGASPEGAPEYKIEAAGHPTALWRAASGDDRIALVGESKAYWLWCIVWPETAGSVLDRVVLHDLRDGGDHELELVFGAQTPRLA